MAARRPAGQVGIALEAEDALVDLMDARIIALRVGPLADPGWIGRKLCEFEAIVWASLAYLERHGTPATPLDLVAPLARPGPGRDARGARRRSADPLPLDLGDRDGRRRGLIRWFAS